MKYLVTGGAGFIGSHLAEECLQNGNEVVVLDNFATGRRDNLKHLEKYPHLKLVQDSIMNYSRMVELVGSCDAVFHMAAAVGVEYILENPLLSIQINFRGTDLLLELANKFQKCVLIASSSEVYGRNNKVPLREDDNRTYGSTAVVRWSYAAGKALDEFLGLAYWQTTHLPVVIIRFFNIIGPRQTGRYGMVVPRLVCQALRGEDLTVYGNGQQSRTFTCVYDAVKAVRRLIGMPEAYGQVFNIGGSKEITILDLAKRIIELTDSKSTIKIVPYEQAYQSGFEDMERRVPDVSKVEKLIGCVNPTSLDDTIRSVIEFFKDRPDIR
ncbi:MAG: GDP-mannose 4,6-dehydratase [Acidobacteriia bacterium]|nr:GDP-mannose 4,6-dehydratase [Terriglobia bacterium]